MARHVAAVLAGIVLLAGACSPAGRTAATAPDAATAFARRPLPTILGERWIGNGICYSPYRDGQRPGGAQPTAAEVREDLGIVAARWNLIRTYGSREGSGTILQVIRDAGLPIRVVLGAWIAPEVRRDATGTIVAPDAEAKAANAAEVEAALRLAAEYPDIVVAIAVGNETQVSWSAHRSDLATLLPYVRQARQESRLPVTTADDYKYWILPESRQLAAELDFVMTHIHPLWNGQSLDDALAWTQRIHAQVAAMHPGVPIIIGESGWATDKRGDGEQAQLIRGTPGEAEQARFFEEYNRWIERERIVSFWFEVFDENWKGSDHPNEVEKHWGLFHADRSPKAAMAGAAAAGDGG